MTFSKEDMARRAAAEIPEGSIVNLGIGLPTLVADYLAEGHAWLHSENGLLGMGPFPYEGEEDPQLINAGKQTVTVLPGGSTFDSATSFAMIRGGHVDIAILGAMQVSASGAPVFFTASSRVTPGASSTTRKSPDGVGSNTPSSVITRATTPFAVSG